MTRKLLVALAATLGALFVVESAQAFTNAPVWKCRASPLYASVSGQNRVEPIVANGNINTANGGNPDHAQCANAETGAGNTATQLAIPQDLIGASTTQAKTEIVPELGKAINQKVTSTAKVENLQVQLPAGSPSLLGVKAATSSRHRDVHERLADAEVRRHEPGRRSHGARCADRARRAARRADAGAPAARRARRHQDQREGHRLRTAR